MKSEHIVGIGIAVIIMALGWVLIGKPVAERRSIRTVLRLDREVGESVARQSGYSDIAWDQSKMVGSLVSGMRQIDLSGCPSDFQIAYLKHIDAWAEYQNVAESNGGWAGVLKGFLYGGAAAISAYQDGSTANAHIRSTFDDVLRCAQEHGVSPP